MIGISSGSRPCWRIHPQFRLDCSPAIRPFSNKTTLLSSCAKKNAVQTPITPPPITIASVSFGCGPAYVIGVFSEIGKGVIKVACILLDCHDKLWKEVKCQKWIIRFLIILLVAMMRLLNKLSNSEFWLSKSSRVALIARCAKLSLQE